VGHIARPLPILERQDSIAADRQVSRVVSENFVIFLRSVVVARKHDKRHTEALKPLPDQEIVADSLSRQGSHHFGIFDFAS
jgi:hypothetical protein